jgi:hypothetical protein
MMTFGLQVAFLILAQSTVAQDVIQLARIEHEMSAVLANMPNYTCEETIERSIREKGMPAFKVSDTLRLNVAFVGGKELFGRRDAARIDKSHPNSFTGHGVTSNGEFVGHARSVFMDNGATIRYFGADETKGRAALRWDYAISLLMSGWTLQYAGRVTQVASKGSFWVDAKSLEILQLDVNATQIEEAFPIAGAHLSLAMRRCRWEIDWFRFRRNPTYT